jgi:DNA-binding MarR family transcriptional regulator
VARRERRQVVAGFQRRRGANEPLHRRERIPDPTDGRAKLVRATARGREVYAIARAFMADVDARLDRELGAARMRRLRALLEDLNAVWR